MYLSHYGLNEPPFGITPNPDFFYPGGKRGEILEALVYAVTHGEGIVKVTGEVGSGKTMLCRMLESRLPENVEVIYLLNPTLGREEVLYAIAGELGLETAGKRADEVIRILQEDLIRRHVHGQRTVLLIEEAQAMPLDTLEEIRLFSNLETAHSKLLQIVLFGQPELDENLSLMRMRQLKERITHSFSVPPLDTTTIREYLMQRLRAAGYRGPDLFAADALRRISDVSQGIMRRITILADKALLSAFAEGTHGIEQRHIDAAVRDCEFAPIKKTRSFALTGTAGIAAGAAAGVLLTLSLMLAWQSFGNATPSDVTEVASASMTNQEAGKPAAGTQAVAAKLQSNTAAHRAPADRTLQESLQMTRAWMEADGRNQFTVQLALTGTQDLAQAERFISRVQRELSGKTVYIYPAIVGGTAQYGISVGAHASLTEAREALTRLRDDYGYRPQIRKVSVLIEEMERGGTALWH